MVGVCVAASAALSACTGAAIVVDDSGAADTEGSDTSDGSTSATPPGVTTLQPDSDGTGGSVDPNPTTVGTSVGTATTLSDSTSAADTDTDTDTDPGSTTDDDEGTSGTNPGGAPDGAQCSANEDCFSNECYLAGALGGICGECNGDNDCDGGGCSLPNPLTSEPAQCNDGEIGGGCESDDACGPGLVCNGVIDIPGIIQSDTCGECVDDTDCPGQTCQPDYDVSGFAGHWSCVGIASLPNGASCDFENATNACAEGICAVADFMSLLPLGVCSECADDSDCGFPQVCTVAEIDLAKGLIPGVCN